MAFSDVGYLLVGAFVFIMVMISLGYAFSAIMTQLSGALPGDVETKVNDSWARNEDFFDTSFIAIFILLSLVSIVLAALVVSHPVIMVAWLLFNMAILFVYDYLNDYLTYFMNSVLNTGAMNNAAAFVQGDMPRVVVILNMLIPIALFGKRVLA